MSMYDVVIIGGGPAGLGAAVALSRARREVLVVDAGEPRNKRASRANSYLGREGIAPRELLAIGRAEVDQYGGEIRDGNVVSVERAGSSTLRVGLADGSTVDGRRVLLATGVVDELPDIPGVQERWGRDVLHCAYCHAWEVRDKVIGVIASGAASLHQAQLWRQWTDRVVFFVNDSLELKVSDRAELAARGIAVVEGQVSEIEVTDDALSGIRVGDDTIAVQVALVFPVSTARTELLGQLGLLPEEKHMDDQVIGTTLTDVDVFGATGVPGVWAAGNVRGHRAQIIDAAAQGVQTGAMINIDLVHEEVAAAVVALPFSSEREREVAERVVVKR
ncbi:NAD(P)/FAD-dependent oxidoreductase [Amycolatopsis minnesotensis]|uniref:NAD(P)/FAD-dependent oxidoreductase n=1 Tax=Amycolatopsis minnesotensis TaxID=337894 RepID=A0ABN2QZ23_9PSEU